MPRIPLAVALGVLVLAAALPARDEEGLTDKTFASWRDRIRPKAAEQAVEAIKWHPTFWDAVVAAQKADRPILLFAMNGHPLACT